MTASDGRSLKKRPLSIKLLAALFLLSPLGLLAQIIYFYEIPLRYWTVAFAPEIWTWQTIACAVLTPIIGLCIWTVHRWAYVVLVAFFALVIVNNVVVAISGLGLWDSGAQIVLGLGFILLVLSCVRREFYAPYFNPRLRWWENAHRYATDRLRILMKSFGKNELLFEAKSFDVSATGLYVLSDHEVRIGDVFGMDIILPNGKVSHASGEVVWRHGSKDDNPLGFGCRFTTTSRDFESELRVALRELGANMKNR